MGHWKGMRYYRDKGEGGGFCEIEDTFAEMFPTLETSPTAHPLFSL